MECSDLSELWISFGLSAFRATSIPSDPSQPLTRDTTRVTSGFASHSVSDVANVTAPPPHPRDQSQRDDMCPDPQRPISRPTPTVKIQSGDKSPHSEIRTPVTVHSSDQIADRHYGVLRLVGALDFLRALSFSSDIHPIRSIATTHPRHDSGDIRLRVSLSPKRRQRHGASTLAREISPNGTTCALTRDVLTRDAQSRGPPHR
jgi:hypothetical protein